ncbi:type IV fimbrial biogenesis protein FimT/type IV fimbrial biogenesis protein FimU [Pseudomonas peli]|uniref:Type II secretion system protein H n=1 Tax=Pseudomonas peli TaxID=592361 RepID=A0AB37Z4S5_9PSED|nr:GspH/FimT family pseudopilin [Pseudomonas peli]NMZ68512.1 prepilin-type N-terminal cleavage/methylation domain-containing protein [Pseudomonas peli]SCW43739.1 type IV fimbrial biogenesis protein FimT/type IV fimbrial biogenesis protein FimU [Pseudomonas peli]
MTLQPRPHGFSLIELMVVLALFAIAIAIAVPNLASLIRNDQIESQAQQINSLLQYARSEAVVRRSRINLSNNGGTWVVRDLSRNEDLRQEVFDATNISIATNPSPLTVTYSPNGTASTASAIVCNDDKVETAYLITIQASGSSRIHARGKQANNTTALGGCTP